MNKKVMQFIMIVMALFLISEASPLKVEAAGNRTPAAEMTEGSGTDLFGDNRRFPCRYNKKDKLFYMEDTAGDVYVYDSQRWTVTPAYRIVDSKGKEHRWNGKMKNGKQILEDGGYLVKTKVYDKNGGEIGTIKKYEVIGFAVSYGGERFVNSFKKLLTGNDKASSEVLLQTVTSKSSVFSKNKESDNAPAVTAMAGVTGTKAFYEELFGLRGPDNKNMPFYVFCNDSQYYSGSGFGENSISAPFYDEDEKRTCAIITLGYKEDMTTYQIIGHEVTHRYFDCLVKAGECDEKPALDEGFSDIMGFMFTDWFDGDESRNAEERMDGSCEWKIDDRDIKAIIEGKTDYPTVYKGDHWNPKNDSHKNSTVLSAAAYKMIQAPVNANKYERLSSYQLANLFFNTMKAMDKEWDCDYQHCAYALRSVAAQMVKAKTINQKQADYVNHILEEAGLPAASAPENTNKQNTSDADTHITIKAPVTNMKNGQKITEWDCVWFGNYWQNTDSDGNGTVECNDSKDPVKWRVLSYDEGSGEALLLADQNLDIIKYNEKNETVDWEMSTIRSFLNNYNWKFNQDKEDYTSTGFLNNAFSKKEAAAILETLVINDDNALFGSEGGAETPDKVFCLSLDEALDPAYGFNKNEIKGKGQEWTMPDNSRVSYNTAFVAGKDGYRSNPAGSAQRWWLRSPGYTSAHAAHADNDGAVNYTGMTVTHSDATVRPAIRINLKKSTGLWTYAGKVNSEK